MDIETARKFRDKYIKEGGRDFTKPAHFELDPGGFFEPHVEVVAILKSDFHELEGGRTLWFRKETLDKIAQAAGLSYEDMPQEKHVRGEPFVCRTRAIIQGPDGQPIMCDVVEGEFDPETRAELDMLRAQQKDGKTFTEIEKRIKVLDYVKVGRARANTAARSRATIVALGMQTGFKDLFRGRDTEWFIFSRIIINVKNKLVAEAQLAALAGTSQKLFGSAPRQIAGTVTHAGDVQHGEDTADIYADDPEPQPDPETRHQFLRRHLGFIAQKYPKVMDNEQTIKKFMQASMDESAPEAVLEKWYKSAIDYLGAAGINYHEENGQ